MNSWEQEEQEKRRKEEEERFMGFLKPFMADFMKTINAQAPSLDLDLVKRYAEDAVLKMFCSPEEVEKHWDILLQAFKDIGTVWLKDTWEPDFASRFTTWMQESVFSGVGVLLSKSHKELEHRIVALEAKLSAPEVLRSITQETMEALKDLGGNGIFSDIGEVDRKAQP